MGSRRGGFSLIELLVVMGVIAILIKIAYPSYTQYLVRASREGAQTMLMQLATLEEKIYLNSSAYTVASDSVTAAYTGASTGGLGLTSGTTSDGKYAISVSGATSTFTLTATPVTGSTQVGDGNITIDQAGTRLRGTTPW
jgi:type IV pilus assembly protein PilE